MSTVCLPQPSLDIDLRLKEAFVVGWGKTGENVTDKSVRNKLLLQPEKFCCSYILNLITENVTLGLSPFF